MARRRDPNTAIIISLFALMALVLAVIAVLGYKLLVGSDGDDGGDGGKAAATSKKCTDDMDCNEDQICDRGKCSKWENSTPDAPPKTKNACAVGASCGGAANCNCLPPNQCCQGLCQPASRCKPVSEVCQIPAVKEALKKLKSECENRGGMDIASCGSAQWEQFALNDARFDEIMAAFPNPITVHFPTARPNLRNDRWPNSSVEYTYTSGLTPMMQSFNDAKLIFVIGRASPRGNPERNKDWAFKRMDFASKMLKKIARQNGGTEAEDKIAGKFLNFALGESKPLNTSFFAANYAQRIVTWSQRSKMQLQSYLSSGAYLSRRQARWAHAHINQVVFLIPVPCDGSEY